MAVAAAGQQERPAAVLQRLAPPEGPELGPGAQGVMAEQVPLQGSQVEHPAAVGAVGVTAAAPAAPVRCS